MVRREGGGSEPKTRRPGFESPQLRYSLLTGEPVIVAPTRATRPGAARPRARRKQAPQRDPACPFCPGNEGECAAEIARLPIEARGDAWSLRVVSNKYPALVSPATAERSDAGAPAAPALGRHEVIIETPRHDLRLVELGESELLQVLRVYRTRFAAAADGRTRHVVIFRNEGPLANASILHPHAQLAALDFVPPLISRVLERSRERLDSAQAPLLLALLQSELDSAERIVDSNQSFAVFVPFAAAHEYELWIVPRQLPPRFDQVGDDCLKELAATLRATLRALDAALAQPDYNLILQTPPLVDGAEMVSPWYIQIIPRLTLSAGFELGIGVQICTTAPEEAAARLRDARAMLAGP